MAKQKNKHPGKKCMWCGGSPVNQEDVFAKWIGRALRHIVPPTVSVDIAERVSTTEGDVVHEHHVTVGMPAGPRRPVVCPKCNGGWMSEIENATKPVLKPMMLGSVPSGGIPLSEEDLVTLGTWATKTALVIDFASPSRTVAGQKIRETFRQTRQPLPNSRIWLAAYVPDPGDLSFWYKTPLGKEGGVAGSEHLVLTTIGVGYFVVQVLLDVRDDASGPPNRRPDLTDLFFEAWPRHVNNMWPPKTAMRRDWIVHFAQTGTRPPGQ